MSFSACILLHVSVMLAIIAHSVISQDLPTMLGFSSAAACAGLFSTSGFAGCSSKKDTNLNAGRMRYFVSNEAVTDAVGKAEFVGSWIIPTSVWCAMNRQQLEGLNLLATSLTIVEENDQPSLCPSSGLDPIWNKFGSGISSSALSYSVARLSRQDSIALINQAQSLSPQKLRFDFYLGKSDGSVDTKYCLEKQKCTPVGGQSVWGTVKSPPLFGERVIVLAANMDSSAFFQDLSFGFHAAGGDIAIALAATHALAQEATTPVRIITGIFQGESFHRIGSRRFLEDVGLGQCKQFSKKTCIDPPNFSLEWTKFNGNLSRFKGVVALHNVLRQDRATNKTYIHALHSDSNTSTTFADRLRHEFIQLGWELPPTRFANLSDLPPSVLTSFAEREQWRQTSDSGGVVLTGYEQDISEANARFETEHDVMDATQLDSYVEQVTQTATAVARALFYMATDGNTSSVIADRGLVESLLRCLGGDFASDCPMALDVLNITAKQLLNRVASSANVARRPYSLAVGKPLASYSGPHFPLAVLSGRVKLRELFIRGVLANMSLGGTIPAPRNAGSFFPCSVEITCRDSWPGVSSCPGPLASNATVACVAGQCICTTVTFHEAWSPDLVLNLNKSIYSVSSTASGADPLWAEPFWKAPVFLSFAPSSTADVAISLTTGLLLTLLSAVGIYVLRKKEASLGKFKLA